jgi:polysaccharide export outer membrane protein
MTKTSVLAVWATAILLVCLPAISQTKPEQQPEKSDTSGAPQSPKVTIPAAPQGQPAGKEKESDPAKLAEPPASATGASDKIYVIGAEDVLRIQVWGELRLSGDFIVRPDGHISMNLINEIQAAGRTCQDLGNDIADRLKSGEFMRNPSVNVQVVEVRSKKYYINGEVNKPGQYFLVTPTTVLEALNNAGGFRDFANKKKIKILRTTAEGMKEFRFDYNSVTHGKKIEENILLTPGDQIIVP